MATKKTTKKAAKKAAKKPAAKKAASKSGVLPLAEIELSDRTDGGVKVYVKKGAPPVELDAAAISKIKAEHPGDAWQEAAKKAALATLGESADESEEDDGGDADDDSDDDDGDSDDDSGSGTGEGGGTGE